MDKVLKELERLRLDILDPDWVQGIYYSEFLEFGEFSPEYEAVLEDLQTRKVFEKIMRAINAWQSCDEDRDKSWASLSQHVDHQKLLAILAYFIDHGTKNVLVKEDRNNALLASRVYFKFMSIPGFKAYNIYHSQLFAHSLACLGYPKAMCDHEEGYFNNRELTSQVNSVMQELHSFVIDLQQIVPSLQLTPDDMNYEDILSNLVDVLGGAIVNKLNVDTIQLNAITVVIYHIIDFLIVGSAEEQTPNQVVVKLVYKVILPKLVAASTDSKNANNLVRASYVACLAWLLSKYTTAALPGFTALLQHLCYTQDGLERQEVRTARVELVTGLMGLLPPHTHRTLVRWLIKLSTSAKYTHRHIAVEMLAKLILENADDPVQAPPQPPPATEPPETLAPEASQNPAENQDASQNPEANPEASQNPEANPEGAQNPDNNPESQNPEGQAAETAVPTDKQTGEQTSPETKKIQVKIEPGLLQREVMQEDTELQEPPVEIDLTLSEEQAATLLQQRAHTVPHADIVRAVYDRVADSSSALRSRALAVLAACLNERTAPLHAAIQELNGDGQVSRLLALAARGSCDERAAVRRASLSLVHRSLVAQQSPLRQQDLAILVGLSRDASILVRSAAMAALGDLVAVRPSDAVVDAFLSGPFHQLSDPETKIQEQIQKMVGEIVLERLQKHSAVTQDMLPWTFLAGVTRHNMRRHLQKVCAMLAKNTSCINHRVVDVVSTHLSAGEEARDLHALVLLTSVARHVECTDMGFVLDYYYRLANDLESSRDARLMPLTLELLALWSRWMPNAARTTLRAHLVQRLAAAHDDGCRLTAATLAAQLDSTDLTWATEMMQLSEQRALSCSVVDEWLRAADLSLVAPVPPSPALLHLFLRSINDPPLEWSAVERGAAVAGCGRLCVRSRAAAAQAAPALARLLHDARAPNCARINALLALTDICTRYTCIVEPLLGDVCSCLAVPADGVAEEAAPLRRVAARSLTRLLLAGYLRLRTPLYYRYCALLADDDHDVREPAEYYITFCLTTDAIYHHFVDCIMYYNQPRENEVSISFDARQLIYDLMLQRMSMVQKLNLQCRLAREVLTHAADVVDETIDGEMPEELSSALLDTITLLCGPRMKLPRKPPRDGEQADIEDLQERVTTNIVSHKMKRTVAEVVVPAVLRLYSRLRSQGGQVSAYLVRIATDLLTDYRQEIEELIDNDEELVQRVQQFQQNIGHEPSFGNTRNLVTASTTHEPETPKAPRRRAPPRSARSPPRKRALRI